MSEFYAAIVLVVCAVFVAATIAVGKSIKLSEASTGNVFGFVVMVLIALPAAATGVALAFYFATRVLGALR